MKRSNDVAEIMNLPEPPKQQFIQKEPIFKNMFAQLEEFFGHLSQQVPKP